MARRRQNLGLLISAAIMALVLWGYVSLSKVYEDDVAVKLSVTPPPNQALLSSIPETITMRVRGTGLEIINLKFLSSSPTCDIDLNTLRPSSPTVYNIERADLVRGASLGGSVQIVSVDPAAMTLTTGDVFTKEVPVQLRSNLATRDGFEVVGSPTFEPTMIEVRGTRSVVESITQWPTQRLSLADLHESTDATIGVSDSLRALVNTVPRSIDVHIDVQQTAELVLDDVQVFVEGGDPSLRVEPTLLSVTIAGGIGVLSGVTSSDVKVKVPSSARGAVRPMVELPQGVRLVSTTPTVVRVAERSN